MNKKIKILIISILAAVIILFIIVKFFAGQKGNGVQQGNNQAPGTLPTSVIRKSAMQVENIGNGDQVKKAYDQFAKQNTGEFQTNEKTGISDSFPIQDKNGKILPLDFFLNSVDSKVNNKVKDMIGTNYYGMFFCENDKKEKEYGISFDIGSEDPSKIKDSNLKVKEAMKLWEPYLLKDLHNIIFPQIKFSDEQLNQTLLFHEGDFRYTDLNLPDGKKSINYTITDYPINRVLIAPSRDCLDKATRFLFDF